LPPLPQPRQATAAQRPVRERVTRAVCRIRGAAGRVKHGTVSSRRSRRRFRDPGRTPACRGGGDQPGPARGRRRRRRLQEHPARRGGRRHRGSRAGRLGWTRGEDDLRSAGTQGSVPGPGRTSSESSGGCPDKFVRAIRTDDEVALLAAVGVVGEAADHEKVAAGPSARAAGAAGACPVGAGLRRRLGRNLLALGSRRARPPPVPVPR
jgi:hypothetical protein